MSAERRGPTRDNPFDPVLHLQCRAPASILCGAAFAPASGRHPASPTHGAIKSVSPRCPACPTIAGFSALRNMSGAGPSRGLTASRLTGFSSSPEASRVRTYRVPRASAPAWHSQAC